MITSELEEAALEGSELGSLSMGPVVRCSLGWSLTVVTGRQEVEEVGMVSGVQQVIEAGAQQLLLLAAQVLAHVVGHKHQSALPPDHQEERVQGLHTCYETC